MSLIVVYFQLFNRSHEYQQTFAILVVEILVKYQREEKRLQRALWLKFHILNCCECDCERWFSMIHLVIVHGTQSAFTCSLIFFFSSSPYFVGVQNLPQICNNWFWLTNPVPFILKSLVGRLYFSSWLLFWPNWKPNGQMKTTETYVYNRRLDSVKILN